MEELILISELNDFIFCPASIYFHKLYGGMDTMLYQSKSQINGTNAHKAVDTNTYSTKKDILTSLSIYSEKYSLVGKLDMYDESKKLLRERKKKVKTIYDGYIFQLYAQYFSLIEMGYEVNKLQIYSMDDNKIYNIKKPEDDTEMYKKFEDLIYNMKTFKLENFIQSNKEKCENCIYEPACDRAIN